MRSGSLNPAASRRGAYCWYFFFSSRPPGPLGVYELVGSLHLGTRLRRAELGDSAVEEVDLVVKVHHWDTRLARDAYIRMQELLSLEVFLLTVDRQPLVLILALG